MLLDGTPVYIQPEQSRQALVPGQLIRCVDESILIELHWSIQLPAHTPLVFYLHDPQGRFYCVPFQVMQMDSIGEKPVASIKVLGKPAPQEQRASRRIAVPDDLMLVCVDNECSGSVIDISPEGMGILIDTHAKATDSRIQIDLSYKKRHYVGNLLVRSCQDQGDGFCRYGLLTNPSTEDPMRRALLAITHDLAQQSEKAGKSAEQYGQAHRLNHRRHTRRLWLGEARVYVREGSNLRVLKIQTFDLSEGGLGFTCAQLIYENSCLLFEKPTANGTFCINAVVRGVHMIPGARYRIGVQFLGKQVAPHEISEEIRNLMSSRAA